MRISDWSSDVCSSDLDAGAMVGHQHYMAAIARITAAVREREAKVAILRDTPAHAIGGGLFARSEERRVGKECVGTCSCRGSPDNYTQKMSNEISRCSNSLNKTEQIKIVERTKT